MQDINPHNESNTMFFPSKTKSSFILQLRNTYKQNCEVAWEDCFSVNAFVIHDWEFPLKISRKKI